MLTRLNMAQAQVLKTLTYNKWLIHICVMVPFKNVSSTYKMILGNRIRYMQELLKNEILPPRQLCVPWRNAKIHSSKKTPPDVPFIPLLLGSRSKKPLQPLDIYRWAFFFPLSSISLKTNQHMAQREEPDGVTWYYLIRMAPKAFWEMHVSKGRLH